jgi:hypothetical protein
MPNDTAADSVEVELGKIRRLLQEAMNLMTDDQIIQLRRIAEGTEHG